MAKPQYKQDTLPCPGLVEPTYLTLDSLDKEDIDAFMAKIETSTPFSKMMSPKKLFEFL